MGDEPPEGRIDGTHQASKADRPSALKSGASNTLVIDETTRITHTNYRGIRA
jgi:hypothetical protein